MMKREQKMGTIGLALIATFIVSPVFQNCAKVNYQTTSAANSTNTATSTSIRSLTIDPTFNQQKADLKVLIVVDDSYTMSQSQTQLANAIDSLLNPLQGHNVEFKVVSTSGVPSNEVDYTLSTKYLTEDRLEIPSSQISSLSSYLVEKTVTNSTTNRHAPLKLYRDSTTSQFSSLKSQIKTAIQSVGVGGSDTEEGLCATARQLFDTASSSFFKSGDKAAIVILSDENDSSDFAKCVSRYTQRVSTKPVVYYNYGQQRAKLTLEYQLVRDGVTSWLPLVWGVSLNGARSITNGDTCSSADQTDAVNKITAQGYIIRNVSSCVYETINASYYGADLGDDGTVSDKNLCTTTTYFNGHSYANLYAMVNAIGLSAAPTSCAKQLIPSNTFSANIDFDSVIKSDTVASASQDLKLALLNKANEKFGSTGYIVAGLVHISGENCSLNSGQSYGVKYQELSQVLGVNNSIIQSLCNTDFSATLSHVSQFMATEATKSYVVSGLQDGESILKVIIHRGSQSIVLTNSDYEVVHATITLTNFTLVSGDTIEVSVGTQ